ncbi:MAG TPA: long-chain fatty acid--CoA ligase [Candidatus Dormibacteraeota bacterium]|nr:long-chain fatty acid--CoA ligase [Candidatus Dormibacteraeota bacterium]
MAVGTPVSTEDVNPDAIADRTTVGVFFRQAARFGDRPLVHHRSGDQPWQVATWADMKRMALAVASALVEAGIKPRDTVVLMSENRVEWLYCDFAIQSVGAITVPIYPSSPPELAQKIASDCGAVLAIASGEHLANKLSTHDTLRSIVRMDVEVTQWVSRPPASLGEINARLEKISPDDLCTIVYTSGTTGEPKGAELAHRCLVDISRAILKVFPLSTDDSTVSFLPYAHVFERINGIFIGLLFGGQTWISRGTDHLARELGEVQPTVMNSVPRVYEKMHSAVMARVREAPAVRRALFHWAVDVGTRFAHEPSPGALLRWQHMLADRLVLSPLRKRLTGGRLRFFISGGAALAQEIEEFFWAIGVPILNGWGMTEVSSGACSNTLAAHRFLSVGKPFPGVELKIAEDGEILVKSPGNMLGYHNNPAATAEMLRDGWIYTGDIGQIDGDGFLKITDRKKALFKTAVGKYVAPQPLEFELMRDHLVERAVVVGEGKPFVTALVVPDWDAARKEGLDESGLRAHVQKLVDVVNATRGNWEQIQYFTLLPEDFSEAKGELSLKLDVKRKVVQDHYRSEIESMYARTR